MPTITRIIKDKNWVSIEVDGASFIGMRKAVYKRLLLQEGDDLDMDRFPQLLAKAEYEPAMETALAYLATRDRSQQELQKRLNTAGYHPEAIQKVLARLEALCLTSDRNFAHAWVQSRNRKALGKHRITQELRRKGIAQEHIDTALESLDPDESTQQATQLAEKLWAKHAQETPPNRKRKVLQALQRRGFPWSEAMDAYRAAAGGQSFDDFDEE